MTDIQKVPNNLNSWKEAGKYIIQHKCGEAFANPEEFCKDYTNKEECEAAISEQIEHYPEKLKEANPGKPHPGAADVRIWPPRQIRIWFNIGEDFIFEGPDPECKIPEPAWDGDVLDISPVPEKPDEEKPDPAQKPDEEKPVKKNGIKKPAKVTAKTKSEIEKTITQAEILIGKLKGIDRKEAAGKIEKAKKEAQNAAKGKSEKQAANALQNLKKQINEGQKIYKKTIEEWKNK